MGLSTVLAGKSSLDDAVISVGRGTTIDVLCSGLLPPNPTELLASSAMDDMLAEAKRKFDIVVIDMPPVVPVVEGLVVARKVNGALLVSRLGKGRRDQLKAAADRFHDANAAILGIVVNGTDHAARSSYYYGSDVGSNGKPKGKPKRGRSQRGKAKKSAAQTSSAVQGNSAKTAPQGAGLARHTSARPPTSPQSKLS